MDVAAAMDFNFNSSPYGGEYDHDLYKGFEDSLIADVIANRNNSLATVPFAWEEKPGVPKTILNVPDDEFSFDVGRHSDSEPVPAGDLFHGGIIRTIDQSNRGEAEVRGRERGVSSSSRLPSSRSRRARSLPPPGIVNQRPRETVPTSSSGSRKWSFIDLLLFRSASDGRAMDNDPLKKYSANFRKHDHDVRSSGSVSNRSFRPSAHELHYNVNRAVSSDMKKKTYLPYKQGILGKFSFNP